MYSCISRYISNKRFKKVAVYDFTVNTIFYSCDKRNIGRKKKYDIDNLTCFATSI